MEVLGYIASVFIGISLGLIGGGGSILTVPVLIYLFGVDTLPATAYSLFIVGVTSLTGVIPKYRQRQVDLKLAAIFGIPSIIMVFLTRALILPALPQQLLTIGSFSLTKSVFVMLLFAVLMMLASVTMIRSSSPTDAEADLRKPLNFPLIIAQGLGEGLLTGLVGAGGGFLIIPALVLLSGIPIKRAIGTSLLIIGVKSLIGFSADLRNFNMPWPLLISLATLAIVGMYAGHQLSSYISGSKLKRGFGGFIFLVAGYILYQMLRSLT
ncbi:MAG: sulfite exporter TauE/SafE family protein [Chitinophagaceae bacterium]|nr:sulfite exporter TauE/SafE family protein [Chitinophagaceae bacterium]